METTFRISYASGESDARASHVATFQKLSQMLCSECSESCKEFFLTEDFSAYQAHAGPKIGWAVEGTNILLRMANCKRLDRIEEISQFLSHFGMNVVNAKPIH